MLAIVEDYMIVEYVEFAIPENKMNCNCLMTENEVCEPYLILWIDCYLSMRNYIMESLYVAAIRMIMMPSCPYFIFIDTSISKHVDIFFDFGFRLRTSEV